MSVHELNLGVVDAVPEFALVALQRWSREKPLHVALRHRRQGAWKAWRWIDVLRDVERCAAGLREQGFTAQSRLALCGAYEPSLLILALAARSLGGHSLVISRHSRGEVLRQQLRQARAAFAYVSRREDVSHWRQASLDLNAPLQVFSTQASATHEGLWQVLPLGALFTAEQLPHAHLAWSRLAGDNVVWVDEGTEWSQGLRHLLQHWLNTGEGFAFPETSDSASRDRREIAPTSLLLSAPRAQTLADEIEARLAPLGSWRRRLCDWTLSDPRHGLRRWIKARVRGLLGFQNLTRIDSPADDNTPAHAAGNLSWLHRAPERAA